MDALMQATLQNNILKERKTKETMFMKYTQGVWRNQEIYEYTK